jgi:uncharacterized membrane protein YGL010W
MNSITPHADEALDTRRPIDRLLGNYSEDHRNPTNQWIHRVCVPLIVWSVTALLFAVPVPAGLGRPGLWVAMAAAPAIGYYFRLSRVLALVMLAAFAAMIAFDWWVYWSYGATALFWLGTGVFVVSWIAQFIGHELEGKRPSFLTDLVYLLVGPLWVWAKLLRKLGVAY